MACALITGAIMGMLGQGLYLSLHYYLCASFQSKFSSSDSIQAANALLASLLIGGTSECLLVVYVSTSTLGIIPFVLGAIFPTFIQKARGKGQFKEKHHSTF